MAYVIVNYWPFLAAAAGVGLVVGWWATGSRHGDDRVRAARKGSAR